MAASQARGFPRQIAGGRRAIAAFYLGAAISLAGMAALAADRAGARGPGAFAQPSAATYSVLTPDSDAPRHGRERITVVGGQGEPSLDFTYVGGGAVCVRLCDGGFFPLAAADGDPASQAAACGALCPDAPTEVYYRDGSDRIEDAVSAHGERYATLPAALRYRKASDATCACHRGRVAYAPLNDATLRRGDAIMTPAGVLVFRGTEGGAHRPGDFTALADAGMPQLQRAEFQAMERVSVAGDGPSLREWLASQSAPALALRRSPDVAARNDETKIRVLVWRGARVE